MDGATQRALKFFYPVVGTHSAAMVQIPAPLGESVDALFLTLIEGKSLLVMDGATQRALKFFYPVVGTHSAAMVQIPAPLGESVDL